MDIFILYCIVIVNMFYCVRKTRLRVVTTANKICQINTYLLSCMSFIVIIIAVNG